jgi:predicted HTH transcriptional regulator
LLARLIAAFANTDGGLLIVGVREPDEIAGVDPKQFQRLYESALKRLNATPDISFEIVEVDGKQIAVISIEKSNELILSNEGAFQRVGESVRPMTSSSISTALARLNSEPSENNAIAEGIATLTTMVEELQQQLVYANSFRGQARNYIVSGLVGAIFGLILTLLFIS